MKTLPGSNKHSEIVATDEPEFNAHHEYSINILIDEVGSKEFDNSLIRFQKGPIKENGVNGCHNEDLLQIVLDRLRGFQKSSFACRENALAITKIEEALHWLNHRTTDRIERGVEGTNEL